MNRTTVTALVLWISLIVGTGTGIAAESANTPAPSSQAGPGDRTPASAAKAGNPAASNWHPKVVFQINDDDDVPVVLRYVTNYLKAEPTAEVAVVGYGEGLDFMLKGAVDSDGKPYADQVQALKDKGVAFKACNNTLKARTLGADAVIPAAVVVPGAVNEIIRLQTREGYAYFKN
ncbi:DsrE family protein [Geobacter sp. SVR]|uniref:DsrE family protein n=1 Tax=Geobacter sp. SVR TaxID=2495594 RepID=UPI00143EFE23|nr:DsrE family protein [Geobacter sp. SVR]BCS54144.1 hypothetical protein GSVR_24520 [Geobacter sp. SVR]GCF87706.1 hypothetical protein GSbR_43060 [Geobacter sp. SVR]